MIYTALERKRASATRAAYGAALFKIYLAFKKFEKEGEKLGEDTSPSDILGMAQFAPEVFDGAVADQDLTNELIAAYLDLLMHERYERARDLGKEEAEAGPLDRLVEAFDAFVEAPPQYGWDGMGSGHFAARVYA